MTNGWPRLRALGIGGRFGVLCLLIVLGAGLAASAKHMVNHHGNRDERPDLSLDDITGAYHGIKTTAPLVRALEEGHPEDLPAAQRETLLSWLKSDRISEDYDNLDLGEMAPAEIIAANCLSCHARSSTDKVASKMPLEYFDDVKAIAFSREINPTDRKILVASIHTHALSLATMSLVLAALVFMTSFPRWLGGSLTFFAGLGLLVDLTAQWFAIYEAGLVPLIVAGGATYGIASGLTCAVIGIDLLLPAKKS